MRRKIVFKSLINNPFAWNFAPEIILEVINWFFKTGLEGEDYTSRAGWYESGVNQLLYGYSANNMQYHAVPFPIQPRGESLKSFVSAIITRALLHECSWGGGSKKIQEWREKNKIDINGYRFLTFPDMPPTVSIAPIYRQHDIFKLLSNLADYEGKELKKEYAHPEFKNRTHPKIIFLTFSTYGKGYFVKIDFSFWEFNYEPGWGLEIARQEPGEYIGAFLSRAIEKLKEMTVETKFTQREEFEAKNHYWTFPDPDKNCRCCTWFENPPICGLMEFRHIKDNMIDDPEHHFCDEWRLNFDIRNPQEYTFIKDKEATE
jgi:hypothetical protein